MWIFHFLFCLYIKMLYLRIKILNENITIPRKVNCKKVYDYIA